jgi:hypothetical protein
MKKREERGEEGARNTLGRVVHAPAHRFFSEWWGVVSERESTRVGCMARGHGTAKQEQRQKHSAFVNIVNV